MIVTLSTREIVVFEFRTILPGTDCSCERMMALDSSRLIATLFVHDAVLVVDNPVLQSRDLIVEGI